MGEARQGFALPMFFLQARHLVLAGGIVPETQHGGCGEGPFELGLTNVRARGAIAFPRRFLGAFDQAARGHKILNPGKAHHSMQLIQEDQRQDCANPGDRLPPVQRLGRVWLCRVDDGSLQVVKDLVVVTHAPEVHRNTLWHGRIGKPRRDASPVRLLSQLRANRGQMVLAVGMLNRREPLGPLAREMHATPEESTGRPHRGGIDIGLREHPAPQQHGDRLGVDRVVLGLAAVERLHIQRVPKDKGNLVLGAEVGEPGPRSRDIRPRRPDPPDRVQWP
jgi:hypothetical protein